MELLQSNSSADGSIQQDSEEGILHTVQEEDKERESTMRNATYHQTDSYKGQNGFTQQLPMIPEEQHPVRSTITGYSDALGG